MQVLKTFFLITKSRIVSCVIYGVIFFILTIMMSQDKGANRGDTMFKESSVKLAIIDYDQSQLSQAICDYMGEKHELADIGMAHDEMAEAFYYEQAEVAVEIPKGFSKSLENEAEDGKNIAVYNGGMSAGNVFVTMQLNQYITAYRRYIQAGWEEKEALERAGKAMELETEVAFARDKKGTSQKPGIHYFFLFLSYIFICMFIMGLGGTLVSFRKPVVEKRMECASTSLLSRNIGLMCGSVLLCLIFYAPFMLLAGCFYTDTFFTKAGGYYVLNAAVFLLVAFGITFLISFLAKSDGVLNILGNVMGLGMSFLSGVMVPMEFMSKDILRFSKFLPTYWYVKAVELVSGQLEGAAQLKEYYRCLIIQGLFALAFFAAALLCSRMKQNLHA